MENKSVFITGGLSGIGKACAIDAALQGANIAIADLPSKTSVAAMADIISLNQKAIFTPCDESDFSQVKTTVKKVVSVFGLSVFHQGYLSASDSDRKRKN